MDIETVFQESANKSHIMRRLENHRITPRNRLAISSQSGESSSHRHPKRVDIILQRVAWSCQIALVIAAVLGYIYTVRPIHQKQLLDEQIAERTISLKAATVTLENLKSEAARLKTENARLGTEAKQTYAQLRSNLALELISIPNICALNSVNKQRNPEDVPTCVKKFVAEKIATYLRPEDRAILFEIVERHGARMKSASVEVTRQFRAKARQLDDELKKVKSEYENAEPEVRAEIFRLRTMRAGGKSIEPDPPTGRIIIRAEEDQQAYDKYAERHGYLIRRLNQLERDKVFFDINLDSAYNGALEKIASQMFDEFSRKTRNR